MRIVRFLTPDTALRVLSARSTFAIQSIQQYVHLGYEHGEGAIGDTHENEAQFDDTRRHYALLAAALISCWTILENDKLSAADWEIFKERKNGIAIVSNVESVKTLLEDLAAGFLSPKQGNQPNENDNRSHWYFRHGRVVYYGNKHPEKFDTMDIWKWKRETYQHQREYRFAFIAASPMMKVDSVIFHVEDPNLYIHEIYLGPEITKADKENFLTGAIAAELAGKIQDFDDHFRRW